MRRALSNSYLNDCGGPTSCKPACPGHAAVTVVLMNLAWNISSISSFACGRWLRFSYSRQGQIFDANWWRTRAHSTAIVGVDGLNRRAWKPFGRLSNNIPSISISMTIDAYQTSQVSKGSSQGFENIDVY